MAFKMKGFSPFTDKASRKAWKAHKKYQKGLEAYEKAMETGKEKYLEKAERKFEKGEKKLTKAAAATQTGRTFTGRKYTSDPEYVGLSGSGAHMVKSAGKELEKKLKKKRGDPKSKFYKG